MAFLIHEPLFYPSHRSPRPCNAPAWARTVSAALAFRTSIISVKLIIITPPELELGIAAVAEVSVEGHPITPS